MNERERALLDTFPNFHDTVIEQLQDLDFAREWLEDSIREFSKTKNIKELLIDFVSFVPLWLNNKQETYHAN
jgi:hypothetical protein